MRRTIRATGRTLHLELFSALALYLMSGVAAAQDGSAFIPINFPGAILTQALDINTRSDIVGRYIDTGSKAHAFLLSGGSFTTIDPPDATGVILSPPCTFPQAAGATATRAAGINPSGDIVGRYTDAAVVTHGFLLSQGAYTTIDFPDAIYTQALGINPAGEIVGDYIDSGCSTHGYVLNQGVFTTLDFPGALFTRPQGINPEGHIVGLYGTTDGKVHGFLLRHGSWSTIDFPGANATILFRISSEGDIVGAYGPGPFPSPLGSHGLLLRNGRLATVDYPGSVFSYASGINPAGAIVGLYADISGAIHGYLRSR
jgi:hypothetical protein